MATFTPPKRATALTFYVMLVSRAGRPQFQTNPTLAAGDVKVSKDGGAFANLTTLPVVTPAGGVAVKVDLSAAEMTADQVAVVFQDAAGAEWDDMALNIATAARQFDDLTFPVVSGRGIDVDANGGVEVGSFQAGALTNAAFAAGAIDAAAIAADAIGSSELAASAVTEIQTGLSTLDAAAVRAAVGLAAANLDTQLAAIAGFIDTEVAAILAAVDTEVAAIKAKTDNLPVNPAAQTNLDVAVSTRAAPGAAMTLTAGERDAAAAALLDLVNAIEAGLTLRQLLRIVGAALGGKTSGAGTATEVFRNALADTKPRITATIDASKNRSAIVLDVS